MSMVVTRQAAGIRSSVVGNRRARVRRHNISVEVDQPLTGNTAVLATHAVRGVAGGAGKAIINMTRVLTEAGVRENLIQVVALGAQRIRAVHGQIRTRKQVGDQLPRRWSLAEFIVTLQQVQIFRAMRAVGAVAAEFAIVITVMAVRAEYTVTHAA